MKYQSQVKQNDGRFIAVVTYEGRVVEFKYYATRANAERAASRMLQKAAA